jgi:ribose-phosphate pyrophosphokinase
MTSAIKIIKFKVIKAYIDGFEEYAFSNIAIKHKHVLDDLMVGGSTFLGITKMLKDRNIGDIYLAVSHVTIPSPNKDMEINFKKIYTTNSKGLDYNLNNIEVIKMFDF